MLNFKMEEYQMVNWKLMEIILMLILKRNMIEVKQRIIILELV